MHPTIESTPHPSTLSTAHDDSVLSRLAGSGLFFYWPMLDPFSRDLGVLILGLDSGSASTVLAKK